MQDGAPDVGYWLGVKFWGKGYATEAVRAVIDYAFTELGHDSLLGRRARHQSGVAARFWKSAASSGPASASAASARSIPRRRSTASGSIAGCGSRSKAGAR